MPGTAEILRALHDRGVRLVALTNWSAETIQHGPEVFPEVFALFDDVVVSGAERVAKPDPEIFTILARRLGHPVEGVFYVDDNVRNVEVARAVGMDAVPFTDADCAAGRPAQRVVCSTETGRAPMRVVDPADWFRVSDVGDGVTLIEEPHVDPLLSANVWHVRGRDRDLVVDAGLGSSPFSRSCRGCSSTTRCWS